MHGEARQPAEEDPRINNHYRPEGRRSALAAHLRPTRSRCRHSSPASSTTSRPAATAQLWRRASPARTRSGPPSPTAPMSTRSSPEIFNRWFDFLKLYVGRGAAGALVADRAGRRVRSSTRRPWASAASPCRPTRSSSSRPTGRAGGIRGTEAGTRPLRQRRGRRTRASRIPGYEQSFNSFPPGDQGAVLVLLGRRQARATRHTRAVMVADSFVWDDARPLADRLQRRHGLWRQWPLDRYPRV